MYTLLPWLWHLLGAEPAGRKSGIVWSPSVFSRRFRGSCRNPDEVHGTLMARRQFPIHLTTDPKKDFVLAVAFAVQRGCSNTLLRANSRRRNRRAAAVVEHENMNGSHIDA